MSLSDIHREQLIEFVKQEPCTVQDVAKHVGVSWVTAERYVKQISDETGEIHMKVFREGTRGALKIVYHVSLGTTHRDEVEKELYLQIRSGRTKNDFEFLDVYQRVDNKSKSASVHTKEQLHKEAIGIADLFDRAEKQLLIFSGNLSFVTLSEKSRSTKAMIEDALARGVHVKILCKISRSTLGNLVSVQHLLEKYAHFEIRHSTQPLRGFIVDGSFCQFKDEEDSRSLRDSEKGQASVTLYRVTDEKWIAWLTRVFWQLWRVSADAKKRKEELERIV